ncbi:MAG: XkdX family protein [Clostridium sp.]
MFNFYNMFYKNGYLKLETIKEACKWEVITVDEFKMITGQNYILQ